MNRISQEGADHINRMVRAIVDSIDSKLNAPAPVVESGKKDKKKKKAAEPSINLIADELNGLIELANQVEREWEKI